MKKILFFSLLACTLVLVPQVSKAACNAEDIVVDGDFSDWVGCDSTASDTVGDSTNMQYWDNNALAWSTTDPGYDTWTFDDAAMMDVVDFKMLNDQNNVYFYMENSWPMMAVKAMDGEYYGMWEIEYSEYMGTDLSEYAFTPTSMPDFDHWMVWSFDVEQDGTYDYYFGAHLQDDDMMGEEDEGGPGLYVFQDADGNGAFSETLDTQLAVLDPNDGVTSQDEGEDIDSLIFEIQQDVTAFYDATGIGYGDTVDVRMETYSDDGDLTDGGEFTFDLGAPYNLKAKDKKKKKVTAQWKKNKNADKYTLRLYTKKGKLKRTVKNITKRKKVIKKLKKGTKYKYKVRSIDVKKNESNIKSSWSKLKSFKTNS